MPLCEQQPAAVNFKTVLDSFAQAPGLPFQEVLTAVRREQASIFSGCNSRPATFAPTGRNRSGSGGNDTAEASDAKGRFGDSASRQAITSVNAVQASKQVMW